MKLSQRWLEKFGGADTEGTALGYRAAPFKVSDKCCYYLKEKPCDRRRVEKTLDVMLDGYITKPVDVDGMIRTLLKFV